MVRRPCSPGKMLERPQLDRNGYGCVLIFNWRARANMATMGDDPRPRTPQPIPPRPMRPAIPSPMSLTRRRFLGSAVAGLSASVGPWSPLRAADTQFQPAWDSLAHYRAPEWFRDAKFGIWAHW